MPRRCISPEVSPSRAHRALPWAATFWFVVAAAGQLIFAFYIASLYGGATLRGDLAGWNKVMPHGYVAGDAAGNLRVGLHLLTAAILSLGVGLMFWLVLHRAPVGFDIKTFTGPFLTFLTFGQYLCR